jgi:hypothetical protein
MYMGWSRDSSVVIVTGYRLEGLDSIPVRGRNFFSFPQRPDQLWGPTSLLSKGTGDGFPEGGVKPPGREADH